MDNKSLEMLEFPRVREIIAGFTSFSASRVIALGLQPESDYNRLSLLLKQSAEARHLLSKEEGFTIGGVYDIREQVSIAARGKILESSALLEVQHTLASMRILRRNLDVVYEEFPLLWDIAVNIVELQSIEKDIGRCISDDGELMDSAAPRLAAVRRELKETRERLLKRLETTVRSPKGRRIIQEPIVTEREGRYVIPVKVEAKKDIKGIVHDVSNTGATVFIEPWTTVELGNDLRELVMEERREVEKVLRELSANVGIHEAEICLNIELVAELDMAFAKARFAQRFRATEPAITTGIAKIESETGMNPGALKLVDARHPLLVEKAVPLTVELGNDYSILVITGPNTGGKTVALKTIGLLSLMAQAGLPIPASPESSIPMFDNIFVDIGDEQSIEQTLSTFSWHIGNIKRIIENTTSNCLVLLDELGTSTDPTEGSALARSILLHFLSCGSMLVATTHYNDLKVFAHSTQGFQNASLDFDPDTLEPKYHMTIGVPGGSNALATASRIGLSSEIITGARELISEGTQRLETLISDLNGEKQKVEVLHHELEKELSQSQLQSMELKNERKQFDMEKRKIVQEARDNIVHEAASLQKEIRNALSELRKQKSKDSIEQARKTMTIVQERLKSEDWHPVASDELIDVGSIAVGDTVLLKEVGIKTEVLGIFPETQQIEVQAGATRLKLGLEGVEKVASAPGALPRKALIKQPLSGRNVNMEFDIRGKRADEVEWEVDAYLNDASLAGLIEVRIIHGIGTGVLRKVVREYLASHALVKSFRPGGKGEGSDGATVAMLS